jgi:hypothetical protein
MAQSLSFKQIKARLKSTRWQIPELGVMDLWGSTGKKLMPTSLLDVLVNLALVDWAIETDADKIRWAGVGTGGTDSLATDTREYDLPSDLLVMTEAFVAYDDSINFEGYPLIPVDRPFLDDPLHTVSPSQVAAFGIKEYNYKEYSLVAGDEVSLIGSGLEITFASLGEDVNGATPPDSFSNEPFFESIVSSADRHVYVDDVSTTSFTLKASAFGVPTPFTINFTFQEVGSSLIAGTVATGRPERIFVWESKVYFDPVPNNVYPVRLWGYRNPTALSSDSDTVGVISPYYQSIYLGCKWAVAKELGVVNEGAIQTQYLDSLRLAKKLDRDLHFATQIASPGHSSEYYSNPSLDR